MNLVKDTIYGKLLKEFSDYRWLLMLQCADRCEELELKEAASGWRWLAKWRRWPTVKIRIGNSGYGWTFDKDMVRRYPHALPYTMRSYFRNYQRISYNLENALEWAARAVGRAITREAMSDEIMSRLMS